jgi:dihydrofolate reductase
VAKLIYAYLASLDGYIEDEAGKFDWAVPDEEVVDFINTIERDVRTYLYGRKMYEMMIGWETRSGDFAEMWQRADKIVFSDTLEQVSTERTRIERRFDPDSVAELKASLDHDLAVSGADLASAAWRAGLIDECQVFVAPVLVGGGKRLFPEQVRQPLELLEQRGFGNGMVFLRYAVSR